MKPLRKIELAWKYRRPLWKYRKLIRYRREILAGVVSLAVVAVAIWASIPDSDTES
jgi:hypothetical protein